MVDYETMSANERLFEAGLLAEFDEAVATKDLGTINTVLAKVGLRQDANGMNWSTEMETKEDRKTLALRSPEEQADTPAIKKKGRGWEISEKRLDVLHEQARDLRRHSTEAHKALAERFSKADLGQHTFKRHAVVGSAIVDFNCHTLGMAIVIDEEGANEVLTTRRDKSLEAVGIRVMRIDAADILENMDAVLERITAGMRLRIEDKKRARRAHGDQMRGSRAPAGRPAPRNRT